MTTNLSIDTDRLRAEVQDKYREVALHPGALHHFHTGRPLALMLGYDSDFVASLPDRAIESFAGVGNPFSLRAVRTGECVVDIPVQNHAPGQLELPSWWQQRDPERFFLVETLRVFSQADFAKKTSTHDVLLFVHGYNTDFEYAVLRTAQLVHDLKFGGVGLTFSWPSTASASGYRTDEAHNAASVPALARLATRHMDAAHLQRLKKSLQQLTACVRKGDVAAYLEHALEFRRILVDCCRSESLTEFVLAIENRLRLIGSRTAMLPGRMEAAVQEHEQLLQAITAGDEAQAEALNRERIHHIREAVVRSLSFSVL